MRTLSLILLLVGCTADDTDTEVVGPGTDETDSDSDSDTDTDDTDCVEVSVYVDADDDGWGDPDRMRMACEPDDGEVLQTGDCNDEEPAINPGEVEVCGDGLDNDCDGGAPDCRYEGDLDLYDHVSSLVDSRTDSAFGTAVALVPDLDGDGRAELLVGRPGDDRYRPGNGWAGVYAGLGRDVSSAEPIISFRRRKDNENLGAAVLGLHLGRGQEPDLVIAAPRAFRGDTEDVGAVHLIFDVTAGSEVDLGNNPGPVYTGSDRKDQAGRTLAAPGDVNGDGTVDLAISATQPTGDKPGRVYLVDGEGGKLADEAFTTVVGGSMFQRMGEILGAVGDTDGDGRGEIVAGAGSRTGATTRLWWFTSPASGTVQAEDAAAILDGGTTVTLQQGVVDGAGDVNDDGYDDVWVGAPAFADPGDQEGAVYLFHGPLEQGWSLDTADAVVSGTDVRQHLGSVVTGAGDLDSDGLPDLLAVTSPSSGIGEIVVVYGGISGSIDAPDARLVGDRSIRRLGQAADAGADLDGDGYLDAVFGAPGFLGDDGQVEILWGRIGY